MLRISGYTHERRPYSTTLYPTSFTPCPDHLRPAQDYSWFVFHPVSYGLRGLLRVCTFWDEKGELTGQLVGLEVDTATITTVMSSNRGDSFFLAHDAVRSGVHTREQTLFGYFVSE